MKKTTAILIFGLVPILSTFPFLLSINNVLPYFPFYPIFDLSHSDSMRDVYGLWLFKQLLIKKICSTWTDFIFYPIGINLSLYLTQIFFLGLLSSLLSFVFSWVTIYNILLLLAFWGIGYFTYCLARNAGLEKNIAIISGLSFQMSPWTYANVLSHLFVLWAVCGFILYAIALTSIISATKNQERVPWRYYLLGSFGFFLTFTTYVYFTIFIAIFSALVVIWYGRKSLKTWSMFLKNMFKLALLSIILVCPFLLIIFCYLHKAGTEALAVPLSLANKWSVDLVSYFLPSEFNPIFKSWVFPIKQNFSGNVAIQSAFINPVILLFGVLGLLNSKNKIKSLWFLVFLLFFSLSLGPFLKINGHTYNLPLPYCLLHVLPIFQAIRDCSMMTGIAHLAMSILFGLGISAYYQRFLGKHKHFIMSILLFLGFILYVNYYFTYTTPNLSPGYKIIKNAPRDKTVLELPYDPYRYANFYAQMYHHKRLINGMGLRLSPFYNNYFEQIWQNILAIPKQTIAALNLGYIIVHKDGYNCKTTTSSLGQEIWSDKKISIFKVSSSGLNIKQYFLDFSSKEKTFAIFKGLSCPEISAETPPRTFRWSSEKKTEIWFYISPKDTQKINFLEIFVYPFVPPFKQTQVMTVFLNQYKIKSLNLEKKWTLYRLKVKDRLKPGLNKLSFEYSHVFRPCDYYPQSKDDRTLAVAFDFLRLK